MTPANFKKFERKVTVAIKKHLAAGGTLKYGTLGSSERNEFCPISCLIGGFPLFHEDLAHAIARSSSIPFSDSDLWKFLNGFDSPNKRDESRAKLFLLGRKLRAQFLPIEQYSD